MILQADARAIPLADKSVHCVVTSPPYWGLRDYGIAPSVWGSDPQCEHKWSEQIVVNATNHTDKRRWQHTRNGRDEEQPKEKRVAWLRTPVGQGNVCRLCGAWRGCYGLEPTPELFVEHTVEILREVGRVLRDDGTCWLNLGDCYTSGGRETHGTRIGYKQETNAGCLTVSDSRPVQPSGLKPKDLVGIPWRVAFALQADGWYLRSDICWSKLNPMPESVKDRPTKAHEYVFLLAKQERYYYDGVAIAEPTGRWRQSGRCSREFEDRDPAHLKYTSGIKQRKLADGSNGNRLNTHLGSSVPWTDRGAGRNKRSVWEIATQPMAMELCLACGFVWESIQGFPRRTVQLEGGGEKIETQCRRCRAWDRWLSHFATFPEALAETCIAAGTSEHGCCAECGAPWERVVEKRFYGNWNPGPGSNGPLKVNAQLPDRKGERFEADYEPPKTVGWQPTCRCDCNDLVPAIVFDPFAGSGTTGEVAYKMVRRFVCSDISGNYLKLMRHRIPPMALLGQAAAADS